jgi:plasmid stabilization system protein ParE
MEIIWTEEASKNLNIIYDYISNDNILAADATVDGIYNKVQLLKNHPNIGYIYKRFGMMDIRIILYGHYRIAYTIINNSKSITILGIYHCTMNIKKFIE